MNTNPTNIECHTRLMLVEQIMALHGRLHGRGSKNPKRYRELLESFELSTLRRTLEESNFPALSLTETAGVIASADISTVPGSARDVLTLQSILP